MKSAAWKGSSLPRRLKSFLSNLSVISLMAKKHNPHAIALYNHHGNYGQLDKQGIITCPDRRFEEMLELWSGLEKSQLT